MNISEKYLKINENTHDKSTHIKICFCYDLGGMNYFTGREKKRGYYLTVYPVEKKNGMESFTAFTGVSECVEECKRQSKKAEANALEKLPAYEKMIIDYIVKKHGYVLEDLKK